MKYPFQKYDANQKKGVVLSLKVTPGAKKDAFGGIFDDDKIKVFLRAPALDGRANEALIDFLAKTFSLKKKDVIILSGEHARFKRVALIIDPILCESVLLKVLM